MKAVFYYFKKHAKINGTLFYCFEYYAFLKKNDPEIKFYLYSISEKDLIYTRKVFENRYEVPAEFIQDVVAINEVAGIHRLPIKKALILDIHTLNQIYYFIPCDIVCYSNEAHEMIRSDKKSIKYFGYYDYQNFDIKEKLKLNFGIFRKINKTNHNAVFVSSRMFNYKDFSLPKELEGYQIITKHEDDHRENMFELFDTVFYFHSALDTNNRLIPESFFYNKRIIIEYNNFYKDSIYLRYEDISKNGLGPYTLDENDLVIKEMLN